VWEQPIDANGHTIPITYLGKDGKQYVAVMAANGGGYFGGDPGDGVMAFALGSAPVKTPPVVVSKAEAPAKAKAPATLPPGPGSALVKRSCGAPCHGMDVVIGVRRERGAWVAMVESMVARGAKATDAETRQIINYLATHFGK
jgi:hypothetical protein